MEIGAGITIGGGITLAASAGGGGGGGADVTGSAEILSAVGNYGAAKGNVGGYGTLTATPDAIQFFQYNTSFSTTFMMFIEGTTGGLTVSTTDINGHTAVSVTCNGATVTSSGSPVNMGGVYLRFEFTGDPFGIVAATGSTLPFSVTLA